MPLWLSESDVRAALSMPELIEAMESALAAFSAGRVVQPVRTVLELGDMAFYALMPAFDREHALLGAKLVTVVASNAGKGLPTHMASISLLDPETGELLAVMDGRYITEARTAAVSAVSTRYLARADASVLAILGSGVQAHSHLEALPLVRPLREVRVWSPHPDHLRQFAASAGAAVRATQTAEEAVRGADVVVLATSSTTPVIRDAWVQAGTHVISVGACRPTHREMDPALVARAHLVVDSRAAALEESGDVVQGIREGRFGPDHIRAELGEIVSGHAVTGEVTVFKSLGLAVEDVVSAGLAYRRARETGSGTQLAL